ncbi:MAG: hypothetical protein ACRBG0_12915 [Lewinella sp.]|uniref:hypothetical protein n=1 Tax=Lewinella sp. TaxID=2004506 RepID=UPI003D6BDF2E
MKNFTFWCFLVLIPCTMSAQIDFFGRSINGGQSPNSASVFLTVGLANETSIVSDAANLKDFDHAARQINLFNLGIGYATQILEIDSLEEIEIDLDTVIGGPVTQNAFRFYMGMQYETFNRDTRTTASVGGSRFRDGGLSFSLRHEMSLLTENNMWEIVPATASAQSLMASVYTGLEAGFDSGFGISLEESGILQLITDHLVRDVAEGDLTFDEYKSLEATLHESIRYQAPKNTGGSEWYLLATVKGQMFISPFQRVPLRFTLGADLGLDITRVRKRNQNRIGIFFKTEYLFY